MNIEEYVQQSREELRQMFGEVGLKDDCKNYDRRNNKNLCTACGHVERGRQEVLRCEVEMCYFYKKGKQR